MRATIDLDDPSIGTVREAWETLSDHGDGRVFGRVSSSGTGVHLKVHGCSEATATALRLRFDDSKRVDFDQQSDLKPKQILFSSKRSRTAGEWRRDLDELIEEYSRRAPPAYMRRMLLTVYPVLRDLDLDLVETIPKVLRS